MNLEKMDLNQLIELENKIKIEKTKRVSIWDSLKSIEKVKKEFDKKIEDLKSEQQKELEKLGFTIVSYNDSKSLSIINFDIKYDETCKYYAVDFEKETNSLSKRIEEVPDEDMQKFSKILNAKIESKSEEALTKLVTPLF